MFLGIALKRLICLVFLVCNIFICVIEYAPSDCFLLNVFRAAVSVLVGPCCPALLESYSRKCAYCCIIGQIKWWWWWWCFFTARCYAYRGTSHGPVSDGTYVHRFLLAALSACLVAAVVLVLHFHNGLSVRPLNTSSCSGKLCGSGELVLWSTDHHPAPAFDARNLLEPLGVRVLQHDLSSHYCGFFDACAERKSLKASCSWCSLLLLLLRAFI